MANSISELAKQVIQFGIDQYGSASALSRKTGVSTANISRWLNSERSPRLAEIEPIFTTLKVSVTLPEIVTPSSDVRFIAPHIVPSGEGNDPPVSEDYLAIPVVDEIQASHGPVSPIDIRSWFMVRRDSPTLRYKKDLLAVIKDRQYNCQGPTIRGGDICIIDRDDIQPEEGAFMLVRTPSTRQGLLGVRGMLCRVHDDGDELTFSSDFKGTKPSVFSISKDYGGDVRRAIVGKVLFCWCDMKGR